jgi:hypothetical protein
LNGQTDEESVNLVPLVTLGAQDVGVAIGYVVFVGLVRVYRRAGNPGGGLGDSFM